MSMLKGAEVAIDPKLGYPPAYAKLCSSQNPYARGPPYTFIPYSLPTHEVTKLEELEKLFPVICSDSRLPNMEKYIDILWKQLDHLGNAGFDPALFRVDHYGNVLYFHADTASPLAWEVDHWFPLSRGGKTVQSNLRLLQKQAYEKKGEKMQFSMPWWDMQVGVSVNQFLSIFASTNADFRQRGFSFLFFSGKSEQLHQIMVAENHSWPQHFIEKKRQLGLAPAAIVPVQKHQYDKMLKPPNTNFPVKTSGAFSGKRWTAEEDEALLKAIQKFRPFDQSQKEEQSESELGALGDSKAIVPVTERYQAKKKNWEMELESELSVTRAIRKELSLRQSHEEEISKKIEEISALNWQINEAKQVNEAERLILEDMECALVRQKRRAEKHRNLAEKQSSYKQCLEKMIRETMHQTVMYKEETRLNQAACNAMMARLETLKADSDVSEREQWKRFKQKEEIKDLVRPYLELEKKRAREEDTKKSINMIGDKKRTRQISSITEAHKENARLVLKEQTKGIEAFDENILLPKTLEENSKKFQKELQELLDEDIEASRNEKEHKTVPGNDCGEQVLALCNADNNDDDNGQGRTNAESVGDNDKQEEEEKALHDDGINQQLFNSTEQEELAIQDVEEERIRKIGKANVDKWLHILLQNTQSGELSPAVVEAKEAINTQNLLHSQVLSFQVKKQPHQNSMHKNSNLVDSENQEPVIIENQEPAIAVRKSKILSVPKAKPWPKMTTHNVLRSSSVFNQRGRAGSSRYDEGDQSTQPYSLDYLSFSRRSASAQRVRGI